MIHMNNSKMNPENVDLAHNLAREIYARQRVGEPITVEDVNTVMAISQQVDIDVIELPPTQVAVKRAPMTS